MNR
ncbi:hypothetical protein YPPY19_1701, partial [Yersinia pestis PY-19]|jgi:hypothetical protein